ncbi:MAG: DNA (cytosine-5-)-methyltransferase [Ruminococcus bromii]|nr:DNA (cytosine-5-)-methyltransferase [Ruminococcus bromii]MEE0008811.1 DNA (cytosine-5-)-methyltransferase [Ruminococcus bromii]
MAIKFFDVFAGIGGFRSGLEAIGGFECIGYCEIDKYAKQAYEAMYDTGGELYFDDARKIVPEQLPEFDLITGGFPCQSFSIAGARKGFDDTRGTLFFEIARIVAVKKPKYIFLQNVPGLLNHDKGRTFETILRTLDGLGYNVCWQVLNIKNFGLLIKAKTKDGYQVAYPGDSIDTAFSGQNSRRGRVGNQVAHTLTTSATQAYYFIDLNPDPKLTEIARCITARQDSGISNRKAEHSGVFVESTDFTDDEKFAVVFVEPNGEVHIGRIRKLTPMECWRLQRFTDDQFDKAKATGLSDSRLYKMAGNAVTVNVIAEIGKIIKIVNDKN